MGWVKVTHTYLQDVQSVPEAVIGGIELLGEVRGHQLGTKGSEGH